MSNCVERTPSYVDYPFSLRPDCLVNLRLPRRLTTADVARLAAFLATLVTDDAAEEYEELLASTGNKKETNDSQQLPSHECPEQTRAAK